MTKVICELLGMTEPFFSSGLERLERMSGQPNVDIRLTADMMSKTHQKTRELGLDPQDTTDQELYQALSNLIKLHDQFLARRLGGTQADDVADMLPRIQKAVERLNVPKSTWCLKHSVAKKLIKSLPPKKVMKTLGYRSVDSMLKREPMGALFAGLRFIESEQWFKNFTMQYDKLTPSDFEIRDIEILSLDSKRWSVAAADYVKLRHHNVVQVKELGVIILLPLPVDRLAGVTITVLSMLLHAINEVRLYNAYFKLHQVRPGFGKRLATSLISDTGHHATVAGHNIHWRVVQRHYGGQGRQSHPEIFEPHLQAEDLLWRKAEESLYRLEPALHFWHGLDYVSAHGQDGLPISFNLMDMALNYVNKLSFEDRVYAHAVAGLWNELYGRYMQQPTIENQVLKQFDSSILEPEILVLDWQRSRA